MSQILTDSLGREMRIDQADPVLARLEEELCALLEEPRGQMPLAPVDHEGHAAFCRQLSDTNLQLVPTVNWYPWDHRPERSGR
jgi:hypothetical protein